MKEKDTSERETFGAGYYLLMAVNALTSIAFYVVNPVLTKYLTDLGVALAIASTIAGLFSLTALCVRPFTGVFADRVSNRKILCVSIPLLALSVIGYSLTTNTALFVFLRVLNGIAFCFNGTTLIAYASQYIPPQRMGEGVGYLGLGNIIASAIGPGIGVAIGQRYGYRMSFLAAGLISLAGLVLLLLVRDNTAVFAPEPAESDGTCGFGINRVIALNVLPIAFLSGLFSFSNGAVTNFLALICEQNGVAGYSLYFTVLAVCLFALRPIAGRLNDRLGLRFILIPAFLLTALGLVMITRAKSLPFLLAACPLMAFGQGGGQPAIQAQCIKDVGPQRRGVATSTFYIFADFFQGAGPIVCGVIAQATNSYASAYYAAALLLLAGLLLFVLLNADRKRKRLAEY